MWPGFTRDLPRVSVPGLQGLVPFFITQQKSDVVVGDDEITATLSSVEEQVGRDRGDEGAQEGDSVVRLDVDEVEKVLRELLDGAGHRCRHHHPFWDGRCVLLAICEALADPGD